VARKIQTGRMSIPAAELSTESPTLQAASERPWAIPKDGVVELILRRYCLMKDVFRYD